jgi:hypothetical protein
MSPQSDSTNPEDPTYVPHALKRGDITESDRQLFEQIQQSLRCFAPDHREPTCHDICAHLAIMYSRYVVHCRGTFFRFEHSWLRIGDREVIIDAYPWAGERPFMIYAGRGTPWFSLYKVCDITPEEYDRQLHSRWTASALNKDFRYGRDNLRTPIVSHKSQGRTWDEYLARVAEVAGISLCDTNTGYYHKYLGKTDDGLLQAACGLKMKEAPPPPDGKGFVKEQESDFAVTCMKCLHFDEVLQRIQQGPPSWPMNQ